MSSVKASRDTTSSSVVDPGYSLLQQSTKQLDIVTKSLATLASAKPWSKLGYFDSTQHHEIEQLFFRFLVSRRVVVSLALERKETIIRVEHNTNNNAGTGDDDDTKSHSLVLLISLAAALSLFIYEGRLVQTFQGDSVAVAKLNQEFYRSDIDGGTFDKLRLECTDKGRLRYLESAYLLYCKQESTNSKNKKAHDDNDDDNTSLACLLEQDQQAREISSLIHSLVKKADPLAQDLVGQSLLPLLLPSSIGNGMKHTRAAKLTRNAKGGTFQIMREMRAHTFKGVSRLKSPSAHLIQFSQAQKRDVLNRLQPGDLIFTYTAGYMSDVFIPGAFKHGITFVGSPEDRAEAGLDANGVMRVYNDLPEGETAKLLEQFQMSTLVQPHYQSGGENKSEAYLNADVIEAVAEGVIFNNLCRIMDTHVNRLVVLRPRITAEERTDALINVFRFLGDNYDFGFNFADASAVVCTEVQYHAFNGKGQLQFELTKRAGHPTLSADDIVNFYLAKPDSFDFVLLVLEDSDRSGHEAKIYIADEGKTALANLMVSGEPK